MVSIHNDIFKLVSITNAEGKAEAILDVNPRSPIFKGHFPSQPVVPGACMVQLVKDMLEGVIDAKLQLKKADQIKFMNVIVPGDKKHLQLTINHRDAGGGAIFVQATISKNEAVCFKFQGTFVL